MQSTAYQGRVSFNPSGEKPYNVFDESAKGRLATFSQEAVRGVLHQNPLSDIYFSQTNINALQDAIRYQVYQRSNGKHTIGRQSDTELQVIMRSIYLQYSKNQPYDVVGQVKVLNKMVLDYAVPIILREIGQYSQYRKDASTLPVPLERSQNVSNAGQKFLYMKDF